MSENDRIAQAVEHAQRSPTREGRVDGGSVGSSPTPVSSLPDAAALDALEDRLAKELAAANALYERGNKGAKHVVALLTDSQAALRALRLALARVEGSMQHDLTFAEEFARRVHQGQYEKYLPESPYVRHLARVVAGVEGLEAQTVAWLHDVVEDTKVPIAAIECLFPPDISSAVEILTRRSGEYYEDYIWRIKRRKHRLAIAVKIADLDDHLRPETEERLPPQLRARYDQATRILLP